MSVRELRKGPVSDLTAGYEGEEGGRTADRVVLRRRRQCRAEQASDRPSAADEVSDPSTPSQTDVGTRRGRTRWTAARTQRW